MLQWPDLLFAAIVAFLFATSAFTLYYLWVYKPGSSESAESDSETPKLRIAPDEEAD